MVRKFIAATASAALCLSSIAPAMAQDYTATDIQAPLGATATFNFRVPLGERTAAREPSYGLTLGYGQVVGADGLGRARTREVRLADLRFGTDGNVREARLASFDLANLDADQQNEEFGGETYLWTVLILLAGGVAVCAFAGCFDGKSSSSPTSPSES